VDTSHSGSATVSVCTKLPELSAPHENATGQKISAFSRSQCGKGDQGSMPLAEFIAKAKALVGDQSMEL